MLNARSKHAPMSFLVIGIIGQRILIPDNGRIIYAEAVVGHKAVVAMR